MCLVGDVKEQCEVLIREKIEELKGEVVALETMPDHIHLFVAMPPDHAPNFIVSVTLTALCVGYRTRDKP